MAFGHYLRRAREGRKMTLTELARRVEISIAYLSRIERQRENPPPDHLISALAGALSLTLSPGVAGTLSLAVDK
jgi:HTH-type transcriptional regulator, competence development regulator